MSNIAKDGMRRIAVVALSLVAVAVIVAGLRAATPGVSGSTGSPGAVQQTVIGTASFFAQVGPVPSLIDFEDQPANAPLAPWAYAARGVIIEQLDGFPIYVGEWRYPESAMIVPSGTKAISSSWSGAPHGGFSEVCNAPPNCILFFNDGASDRIRFTFTVPVSAAGIHLGQNDVAGTRVTWYDTAGSVIASQNFLGFQPWSDFVGLVNPARPIGSMIVENPANNGDAVYFDDLMFVPVTARASDERPFWTEAAPLNAARYGHTTTLLNDGRVLVAGGSDAAGTPLASAELYDPALNRWTSVASMTIARSGHGAVLLGNGLVLVTGGSTVTTPTKTAELYDPVANAWRSAGTMTLPRSAHSQTFLADGRVLVAGGYTPNADPYQVYANSAELYDPVPNTWTSTGSMQTRRVVHTATLLPDGRVLIAGGANYAEYVGTAEIFSPTTGTWTSAGAMSDRRYGAAAVTRPDGTVLVIGGANFFGRLATTAIFNPAGGWTAGPVMQSARFAPVAVAMGDQRILVAGGHANSSLVSAEILDPAASPGQWTPVASLHTARYSAGSAVLLQDGGVLVAGGYDLPAATTVSSAEIWNSGRTITALTLDRAAGTFGGVVSLTARLTAFGSPVSGRSVLFALNGTAAGTATTDANGVATLNGVPVTNLNAGTYLRAVSASVDADATSTPSTATADLEIAKADAVLSVTSATIPYDGTPKQVSVTTTPSALTGITVTYDGSANPPSQPGTYAVVAHLDNPNYSAADATGTLTIESRSTTTLLQVAPAVLVDGRPAGIRARVTNAAGLAVAGGSVRVDELAGAGIPQRTLATLSVGQDGTAFAVIPALSIGVHRLQAVYLGNGASDPSTSVEVVATVVSAAQGALRVWGSNSDGQIGNGQIGGKFPQPFSPLTSGVIAASAGAWHSVAATGDGRVLAWGRNDKGQLGIGSVSAPQAAPALVPGVSDVSQFATGLFHTLALSHGSVWAWGSNETGQLGDGSRTNRLAPVGINLGSVRAIAAGDYHSAALMNDGTVRTWGLNGFGSLGDGTSTERDVPTAVPGLSGVVSIRASFFNTLALKGDGTVWSWGNNQWGQAGNGGTSFAVLTPIQVPGLSNVIAVAAGYTHRLVLKDDGTIWAWGTNNAGQLGVGTQVPSYVPVQVPGLTGIVAISAGVDTSFAIAADGTVWGWGWNVFGQLAMPVAQTFTSVPVRLPLPAGIGAIVSGGYHVLGTGPAPLTIVAPASLAFGDQVRATQATPQRVTIVNRGNAALHVTSAEVTFNSSDYVIVADGCSGRTLANAPDAACTIDVAFRPASLGVRNAFLVITDGAPDSPHSIPLSGTGLDPNRAPVAVASATPNPAEATSAAGAIVSIDATASSDPDGDSLTYRWTEGATTLATTASANVTLSVGTHVLTVVVDDGKGGSASASVSVRVDDTIAPTVTITSPLQGAIYLTGSQQRHAFTCQDAGSGIASCTTSSASGEFINTATPGANTFVVTATDKAGKQTTQAVTYTVNAPPVAQSSTATVDEDTTSDIVISGADPDGSALTYAIAQPPVKGKIDAVRLLPDGRALVVYTPAQQFSGDDSFTFTVSDGVQTSSPAAVHITVMPVNDRPQIVMSAANTFGGRFGSATHVPVGQSPRAPVMADFNGDGRLDIAIANRTDRAITILLGDGGGAFVARTVDNVGDGPVWLAAGDFDGDTKVDLAVADQSWQAIILLGNGDGSFRPFGTISEVAAPQHVRTADMNRDGVLDLIFASFSSGVVFARGNGDGTFAPPEPLGPVDLATMSVAAGDVNGDGVPDIVAANQQGNSLAVLLGSGSQSFTVPTLIPQDWGPYSVELADFNGDGRLDIAAGVNIVNQVAIRLGNGDGTFGLPRYITTGVVPFSLAVADLNRDGRVDLVVANEASATGSVLLGRGDGTFDPPATYPTGTDPRGVAVGDLNGDGGLDLAIANMTGGSVSVLLAKPDGAAAPRYVEGASPIPLAGTAHVLDPDFAGGTLLVALANAQDGDLLTIATGSRVTASPNDVSVDGQVIAVRSGGMNGAPLELTFNGAISLDAVDVVLQHVAFASSSENPSVQPRSVSLVVIDDAGAASDPLNVNVSVEAVNDAPTAVAAAAPNPAEATSSAGAVVTVDGAGTTDAEGDPLSYQWSEGTTILATTSSAALSLTVGDHVLVLRASDGRGGIAQKSILVTVKDTTAPVLSNVPADILAEATGASGATVSWTSPEATDLVEGDKTVTCAPASGSTFAIGQTSVRCETFDSRGNGTLAIFAVTVRDTTAPVIAGMPAAVSKEATGPAGAMAMWTAPTATDLVDGVLTVSCDRVSGGTFALGLTTVTCAVADRLGNRASATFTVTVADTTAPSLLVPPPFALTIEATGPAGAQITFNLTAPDAVSGTVPATCLPVNGTMFPIGVTTVTCSATDAAGNRATISFPYTVRDTTAPVMTNVPTSSDVVITSSPFTVGAILATDAVGVASVTVNGVPAVQSSPGGFWAAKVPVVLPVLPGGALTFTVIARDAVGNAATRQLIVDNDGISSAIDRNAVTGADESTWFSSDFVSGLARGGIANRAGHTVGIRPTSFGVIATVAGPGGTAVIRACSATKEVWFDRDGEAADIRCAATGTVRVQATRALPRIEVRKLVTTTTGWLRPRTYQYWSVASLATGQSFSTGSPLTADAENTEPITVTLLQIDDNGIETVIGTVVLDPGEAADVQFLEGADGQDDRAEIVGLAGDVQVTIAGTTVSVHEGETQTPFVDRTAPAIASVTPSVPIMWPPNGKMVAETIAVRVTDNVDAAPVCRIVGVTSNEAVSRDGDWTITGNLTLTLRANRLGGGTGRIYRITVGCIDAAGNTSTATASVSVPHDQGK